MLDGDTNEWTAQSFVPFNRPNLGPSTFVFGIHEFTLPPVSDDLFTADGLDVECFIEKLKMSNQAQQGLLFLNVVNAAVEQFARRQFPGAAPGLADQFLAQVSNTCDFSIGFLLWLMFDLTFPSWIALGASVP